MGKFHEAASIENLRNQGLPHSPGPPIPLAKPTRTRHPQGGDEGSCPGSLVSQGWSQGPHRFIKVHPGLDPQHHSCEIHTPPASLCFSWDLLERLSASPFSQWQEQSCWDPGPGSWLVDLAVWSGRGFSLGFAASRGSMPRGSAYREGAKAPLSEKKRFQNPQTTPGSRAV